MVYVLDTNIFLRILTKDDLATYQDCFSLIEAVKSGKIQAVVPGIVLTELVWTLSSFYNLSKPQVTDAVEAVMNVKGLQVVDEYDYRTALEWYQQKNIKYVDCVIASLPKVATKEWAIVSFDHDFDKIKVTRLEPKKVL